MTGAIHHTVTCGAESGTNIYTIYHSWTNATTPLLSSFKKKRIYLIHCFIVLNYYNAKFIVTSDLLKAWHIKLNTSCWNLEKVVYKLYAPLKLQPRWHYRRYVLQKSLRFITFLHRWNFIQFLYISLNTNTVADWKKKTDTYSRSYIPFYFSKKKHEVVDLQSVSACQSTSYLVGGNHVEGRKKPIIPLCSLNRVILKTVSQCPLAAWCVRWEAVNVSVIGQAVYFGKSPL